MLYSLTSGMAVSWRPVRESSNPRAAAELACVVGRDFQMMWQEGEAEERIQEGDLQGTTEKSRKKHRQDM